MYVSPFAKLALIEWGNNWKAIVIITFFFIASFIVYCLLNVLLVTAKLLILFDINDYLSTIVSLYTYQNFCYPTNSIKCGIVCD